MKKRNHLDKVPYKDGKPVWYAHPGFAYEWRENTPFHAELVFKHFLRGCSSAKLIVEDQDGNELSVFLADTIDIINVSSHGRVSGTFRFVKRGMDYALIPHQISTIKTPSM